MNPFTRRFFKGIFAATVITAVVFSLIYIMLEAIR